MSKLTCKTSQFPSAPALNLKQAEVKERQGLPVNLLLDPGHTASGPVQQEPEGAASFEQAAITPLSGSGHDAAHHAVLQEDGE